MSLSERSDERDELIVEPLTRIIAFATLLAWFAIHTVAGCTTLGGKYETGGEEYVDVCFFNAGGW